MADVIQPYRKGGLYGRGHHPGAQGVFMLKLSTIKQLQIPGAFKVRASNPADYEKKIVFNCQLLMNLNVNWKPVYFKQIP